MLTRVLATTAFVTTLLVGIPDGADGSDIAACESDFIEVVMLIEERKDVWDILRAEELPKDEKEYSVCEVVEPVEDFFGELNFRAFQDIDDGLVFFQRTSKVGEGGAHLFGPYKYPEPHALQKVRSHPEDE